MPIETKKISQVSFQEDKKGIHVFLQEIPTEGVFQEGCEEPLDPFLGMIRPRRTFIWCFYYPLAPGKPRGFPFSRMVSSKVKQLNFQLNISFKGLHLAEIIHP